MVIISLLQRSCVFKWIGAVAVELDNDLPNHLTQLLTPLYREESDSTNTAGTNFIIVTDQLLLLTTQGKNYIH